MPGLFGFALQSAQGPRTASTPTARSSRPITSYIALACDGSPVAPSAMLPGPGLLPGYMTDQAPSWSAPMRMGRPRRVRAAKRCIRWVIAVAASGLGRLSFER